MKTLINLFFILLVTSFFVSCDISDNQPTSDSGVKKATVKVETNADGNTIEQMNVAKRLQNDNRVGAIKHLYVISPYSGQVIIYSTVKGKVTSSGKRLTPKTVDGNGLHNDGGDNSVYINKRKLITNEVIQDDGTYGDSDPYIYWWDVKGIYHQHFMAGGQIVHVSDQPLSVKSVMINMNIEN
jgi:hypothetical protein